MTLLRCGIDFKHTTVAVASVVNIAAISGTTATAGIAATTDTATATAKIDLLDCFPRGETLSIDCSVLRLVLLLLGSSIGSKLGAKLRSSFSIPSYACGYQSKAYFCTL